jgi:glutaredoxin
MDYDDWLNQADDPRYIPGIYNYCDSWCQRCPFTERCLNYAQRPDFLKEESGEELDGDALWEHIEETLRSSLDLLRQIVEEEGIDLDDVDLSEEMQAQAEEEEWSANHPLTRAAEDYIGMANDWFSVAGGDPEQEASDLDVLAALGPFSDSQIEELAEAAQVIRWYQLFITVKIQRALNSRRREDRDRELWEGHLRDSDGSAKIALIAIDRSVGAWGTLLHAVPARRLETVKQLSHLAQLRQNLEREFPNAWAFIRPGFDEAEEAQ